MESFEPFMDCLLHPAKCRVLIRLAERGQATPEELAEFGRKVGELLLPLMENPPGGERRAHTIATIVTPPQES